MGGRNGRMEINWWFELVIEWPMRCGSAGNGETFQRRKRWPTESVDAGGPSTSSPAFSLFPLVGERRRRDEIRCGGR